METKRTGTRLLEEALTREVIGSFFAVYNELGYGFLESVYRKALAQSLRERGREVVEEVELDVRFRGIKVGFFRADAIVDRRLIIETKAAERIGEAHRAQLRNYLRASDLELGLVLNFGPKAEFGRVILTNDRKPPRHPSPLAHSV